MRLLERKVDSNLSLVEFVGDSIPRYAILSHTWGADNEEVTYKDLIEGTYMMKPGYKKIEFCAIQAAKDDLCYFWVDTCCIDKSSSAELSEAINSMFAWYHNATRCYVYLSDVPASGPTSGIPSQQSWIAAFQQSRWFTRGWTLQELIAPALVEFFSAEGQRLGDKVSMVQELHCITGISVEALLQSPLHKLSVDERMSWVEQRNTKREEDAAYSLLGLFDVHMPLLYGEGRKKAFARLQKEINAQSIEHGLIREQGQAASGRNRTHEPFSTVPFAPDADFVDRPEILAWVRNKCAGRGARAALVGLGGVGAVLTPQSKSQLAIEYAHRVRDAAPRTFVFWVHASSRARFTEAYRGLADRLELPGRLDPKADILRLVSNWLCDESNGHWTMVVDNVDDAETFFPSRQQGQESAPVSLAAYLPQSRNGSILITSRSKDVAARLAGGYHNIKSVLAMDESQGLQLLHKKLSVEPNEDSAALELLRTLDGMPLAIAQAAAYINRRARMTIAKYLSEFRANEKRLLDWDAGDLRRDESASNSVVTTWQISFEQIQRERPSAAELLSLMCFFNPQGIPERTLRRWSRTTARVGASDSDSEADHTFHEDLDTLFAYSLVAPTAEKEVYEMHALVQFCMRVWLSSFSEVERWTCEFVGLLAQEFPNGKFENWKRCEQLLPHVEPLYDVEPISEQSLEAWAKLLTNAAWYLMTKGSYQAAQAIAIKAIAAQERILGKNDKKTLRSVTVLAIVLRYQGKYEDAEELNRRVLEGMEEALGVHHPDTLSSVNNLALVLRYQGKYEDAEKLHRRALEGREKELGIHHLDTLSSVNNLASVLQHQGKYEDAEKLYRRALEGCEKELGGYHPDTLSSVNNLALVLHHQGKYEDAEKLYRRALEGLEKELGGYHPDTLTSVYCLARLLHTVGRYAKATELYERAYNGFVQKLGVQHPKTIACSKNRLALQEDIIQAAQVKDSSPATHS